MEYQCHDAQCVTDRAHDVTYAADLVVEWASYDLDDHGNWDDDEPYYITATIGRASPTHHLPAGLDGPTVTTVYFAQTAAAVPVDTMRRALALAEAHDPELAAELRASLIEAEVP